MNPQLFGRIVDLIEKEKLHFFYPTMDETETLYVKHLYVTISEMRRFVLDNNVHVDNGIQVMDNQGNVVTRYVHQLIDYSTFEFLYFLWEGLELDKMAEDVRKEARISEV